MAKQNGKNSGKPNILVMWGDDIGITNLSCYSDGLMGFETPNIDRLAKEGLRFLHYYGEQSCTAGRAAFLTGQHGIRTGLTKVGFPEESKNWADPVIGVRGIANLSPRVFVTGKFDVGGFGIGSDFTGQAFGGAGFQVKPRIALIGGYRYLRADYVSDEGFVFKTTMNGILLGAKFKL